MTPVPDKQLTDVVEDIRETAERLSIEGQLRADPLSEEARLRAKMDDCARSLFVALRQIASLNTAPAGDDVVERVAKALAKDAGDHWFVCDRYSKENERWLKAARAALKATTHTEEKAK